MDLCIILEDTVGTMHILLAVYLLYIGNHNSIVFSEPDPCLPNNYNILAIDGSRNSNCSKVSSKCDHYLDSMWYKTPDASIATSCPELLRCGFTYPVWMKGPLPMAVEGIVNRTGCMVTGTNPEDCCPENTTNIIRIKNCSTFFVYFLEKRPGCDEGYCFDSNLPCPTTATSRTTTTSARITPIKPAEAKDSVANLNTDSTVAIAIAIVVAVAIVTVGVFGIIYMKHRPVETNKSSSIVVSIEAGEKNIVK